MYLNAQLYPVNRITLLVTPTDMECCNQQANLPELVQDEDVCYLGCHPHVVRSVS